MNTVLSHRNRLISELGPVYHPLRDTYLRIFKPQYYRQNVKQLRTFYSQFVRPGALVFDAGANHGEYTRCFVDLGAKVVAIEPQPVCIENINMVYPRTRVFIEQCAVGDRIGSATMQLSDTDVLSSLSEDWIATAEKTKRFGNVKWDKKITVPIVTLDSLITKYGEPEFIKIDVEGYEPAVLRGLSRMPQTLSFEFQSEMLAPTIECINSPLFDRAEFNYYTTDAHELALTEWVGRAKMLDVINGTISAVETFGDILVRRLKK